MLGLQQPQQLQARTQPTPCAFGACSRPVQPPARHCLPTQQRREVVAARRHVQTCSTSGAASGAGGSLPAGLGVLQQTRPIDRLRYQAKLVFDHFDTDNDGKLTPAQVGQYVEYCNERFGTGRSELDSLYAPLLASGESLGFEEFSDLVRAQVAALSANNRFIESKLKGAELGRLVYKCAITGQELTRALVVFLLMDFNNDGFLRVDELEKAQGIEKRIFEDVLRDADTNNDGFLTYEDFLTSYARDRPVFLSMLVMAAHTAAFYLIFNSPLDNIFKIVISAFLVLRPALITNPVIKIYQIASTLLGRARATQEVMSAGGSATA